MYICSFMVMFRVCCPYLRAVLDLVPGVRSMTELGAALLVLSRGKKWFNVGHDRNTYHTMTSTKLRAHNPLGSQFPNLYIYG